MSTTINAERGTNADGRTLERLAFDERTTKELKAELTELRKSIQKCADAAMCDGRPDVSETPIVAQDETYRENYAAVMNELIDRGEI